VSIGVRLEAGERGVADAAPGPVAIRCMLTASYGLSIT
jgi:hypothetical protein